MLKVSRRKLPPIAKAILKDCTGDGNRCELASLPDLDRAILLDTLRWAMPEIDWDDVSEIAVEEVQ